MNRRTRSIFTAAAFLLLTACSPESRFDGAAGKAFIDVDGKVLTLAEFNELFEAFQLDYAVPKTGKALREVRADFLLQLVEEMIILRRAEELELTVSDRELAEAVREIRRSYGPEGFDEIFIKQAVSRETWEKRLEMQLLIDKVIQADLARRISVEPEDLSTFFKAHNEREGREPAVSVRQILVSDREDAERMLKRIRKGEDFSDLARQYSQAPEAARGGDMGCVTPGDLPEPLEKAIFRLDEGEVSAITSSPYGYHIFQVQNKATTDDDDTHVRLKEARKEVRRQKLEAAYRPWVDQLRARYEITVNNEMM